MAFFEVRVYAEDPVIIFCLILGHFNTYKRPTRLGCSSRDGFERGEEDSLFYSEIPLKFSKLINFWKKNRERKLDLRMLRAIEDYEDLSGVETTLAFCKFAMSHEAFL